MDVQDAGLKKHAMINGGKLMSKNTTESDKDFLQWKIEAQESQIKHLMDDNHYLRYKVSELRKCVSPHLHCNPINSNDDNWLMIKKSDYKDLQLHMNQLPRERVCIQMNVEKRSMQRIIDNCFHEIGDIK